MKRGLLKPVSSEQLSCSFTARRISEAWSGGLQTCAADDPLPMLLMEWHLLTRIFNLFPEIILSFCQPANHFRQLILYDSLAAMSVLVHPHFHGELLGAEPRKLLLAHPLILQVAKHRAVEQHWEDGLRDIFF